MLQQIQNQINKTEKIFVVSSHKSSLDGKHEFVKFEKFCYLLTMLNHELDLWNDAKTVSIHSPFPEILLC